MKYVGVKFSSYDKPFDVAGKVYYYKTNLNLEKENVAYTIETNGYAYDNPVVVVEVRKDSPDPSRDFKEITKAKPIKYTERRLPDWIIPKNVYFNPNKGGITCILWENGERTVVKCSEEDIFDFEKGFTMAIATRLYNKANLSKYFKKFVREPENEYFEELFNLVGYDFNKEND